MISLATLIVVIVGLWLGNLLKWVGVPSPLFHSNKNEVGVVEKVADKASVVVVADSAAVVTAQ
ncbi:MAG: hypothetical protein IJ956_05450 [Akkermansia sp.]|nr:hypothetical protein [Akkermansia sp.]